MAKQMQMSQKVGSGRENLQSAEAKGYNQPMSEDILYPRFAERRLALPPETWLGMQTGYDLWQVRERN